MFDLLIILIYGVTQKIQSKKVTSKPSLESQEKNDESYELIANIASASSSAFREANITNAYEN